MKRPFAERFWAKVDKTGECWECRPYCTEERRSGRMSNKRLLLIDGDEILFRGCAAVEQEARFNVILDEIDWDEPPVHVLYSHPGRALETIDSMLERIFERFETREHYLCFSAGPNFRYKVCSTYKNNRAGSRKPLAYQLAREEVEKKYTCKSLPGLEADDIMGIIATTPAVIKSRQPIIVSADKDMQTIPTQVWRQGELVAISEEAADRFHMMQTLIGDTSDGYKGCPGVGKVKAEKLLNAAVENAVPLWTVVVAAYEKAGLTEQDALTQARLARILRWSDWNEKEKCPVLWTPK